MDTLIIAPHVDDELIGCYSAFFHQHVGQVAVLYTAELELTNVRCLEAERAANRLGFTPIFDSVNWSKNVDWGTVKSVYVPRRQDKHPDHRAANAEWRTRATHFYSIDMNCGAKPLPQAEAEHKCRLLYNLYPSQRLYFDQHAECWMFEHIAERDYDVYRTWRFGWENDIVVYALQQHDKAVNEWWDSGCRVLNNDAAKAFNALVAACPRGDVELQWEGQVFRISDA